MSFKVTLRLLRNLRTVIKLVLHAAVKFFLIHQRVLILHLKLFGSLR